MHHTAPHCNTLQYTATAGGERELGIRWKSKEYRQQAAAPAANRDQTPIHTPAAQNAIRTLRMCVRVGVCGGVCVYVCIHVGTHK